MTRKTTQNRVSSEARSHKLYAPPAHVETIRRSGLLARLFEREDVRVTIIQAPAGHGKSTLLQQAMAECKARGARTSWLTLDEADNDISRLYRYLDDMLGLLGAADRGFAQSLGPDTFWDYADRFLDHLAGLSAPVALFFDEFQQLSEISLLKFFRRVIESIPAGCRIFIGSRTIPDIGLSRLATYGEALVLTTRDLLFTDSETRSFFQTSALALQPDEVAAIYQHTEGWAAALQLFRLSLPNPQIRKLLGELDAFRLPRLTDYLADSVLAHQTETVQTFLLHTAPLTRLCAPLCDAVLEQSGSQEILRWLEQSGLFIRALDAQGVWFRYHTLFSNFLRLHLSQLDPTALRRIHQRALDWYVAQELPEEALHHALSLRDHARAADILQSWAGDLIADGQLATVERWSERLPLEVLKPRPSLAVKVAWALMFLRRRAKCKPVFDILDQQGRMEADLYDSDPQIAYAMEAVLRDDLERAFALVRGVEISAGVTGRFQAFALSAAANLQAFQAITEARFEDARRDLIIARFLSEQASALFSWGYAISVGGMRLIVEGRLNEALDHLQQGMARPLLTVEGSYSAASLVAVYCLALYETGGLTEAETQFQTFREVVAHATMVDFCAAAYITMARIHVASGRSGQALSLLDEAEEIGAAIMPRLSRVVARERIRIACVQGDIDRAEALASRILPEWASTPHPAGWFPFAEDAEGDKICRIRLDIHAGRPDQALALIGQEIGVARQFGRTRRALKLTLLEAMAYEVKKQPALAQRSLVKALTQAEPLGFFRMFLDEGEIVTTLLAEQLRAMAPGSEDGAPGRLMRFIQRLLVAAGIKPVPVARLQTSLPLEPLTAREREILVLLANGASNQVLAARVLISENTVKFHLKNLYAKLAVKGRVQAIITARSLGLI